jgi:hypothetical protein
MNMLKMQEQSYLNQSYSTARSQAFYVDSDTLLQYLAPNVDLLRQDKLEQVVYDLLYSYVLDHALYVQGERLGYMAEYLSSIGLDVIPTEYLAFEYLDRINNLLEDHGINIDSVFIDVYPVHGTASVIFNIQEM